MLSERRKDLFERKEDEEGIDEEEKHELDGDDEDEMDNEEFDEGYEYSLMKE